MHKTSHFKIKLVFFSKPLRVFFVSLMLNKTIKSHRVVNGYFGKVYKTKFALDLFFKISFVGFSIDSVELKCVKELFFVSAVQCCNADINKKDSSLYYFLLSVYNALQNKSFLALIDFHTATVSES